MFTAFRQYFKNTEIFPIASFVAKIMSILLAHQDMRSHMLLRSLFWAYGLKRKLTLTSDRWILGAR